MNRVALPDALTAAKWNAQKTIIAKLKTKTNETGITAALNAVQTAYNAIHWQDIEAKQLTAYPSEAAVKDQIKKVMGEVTKIGVLISALQKAHAQAEATVPLFRNSKIIPKSATTAVQGISFFSNNMVLNLQDAKKEAEAELKQLVEWAKGKAHGF